jgi:predicted metal-dependent enzyme (double-stranded beta helix superfamily)
LPKSSITLRSSLPREIAPYENPSAAVGYSKLRVFAADSRGNLSNHIRAPWPRPDCETTGRSVPCEIHHHDTAPAGAGVRAQSCPPKGSHVFEPGKFIDQSDDLTILNVIWAPRMILLPHNHRMWAVIGIYSGREDNIFWRRVPGSQDGKVEAVGAKSLCERDAEPLGPDIIHSVTNPISRLTCALHVYGGDFFAPGRSEWDPETLTEGPCDPARIMRRFEGSNALID